jgi:hypothetical protein
VTSVRPADRSIERTGDALTSPERRSAGEDAAGTAPLERITTMASEADALVAGIWGRNVPDRVEEAIA